ncbi:beta-N-acetylhexosaminidase [Cohnella caldifontis]|uniref:beta-N-acetylhexosaminidase n=1 Tax=Cohnella caldifontis TaxID=3027471 RepID=UPI0023EBADF0|nr:beta-N-acetylhexosaminidase [Cohnella sp. YIM B05605]
MSARGWIGSGLLLLLLIGGCGSGSTPSPAGTASSPVESAPAGTTAPPSSPSSVPSPSASSDSGAGEGGASESGDDLARLVRSMTLEEKIGQLLLAGVEGTTADAAARRMIAEDRVGGIILFKNNLSSGVRSSVELLNGLKAANAGNPAPLFLSVDQEGGRVNRLPKDFVPMPANAAVGKTGQAPLAKEMGALIARQLKLLGFNTDFAPVLDINSNPKNPVIGDRSFGSRADLVTDMGLAETAGIRGGGIIPVVKHFPGHGDTAVDSHLDLPIVRKTEAELQALELIPFEAAVQSGADAVMVAHILFPELDPDVPASLSGNIIGGLLRGKLGFDGVVITDDLSMGAIAKHYGLEDAAIRAVLAGADVLLMAHGYGTEHRIREALLGAVGDGRIPESRIDESVTRILKLKRTYGLTDDAVPVPSASDLPNADIRRWLAEVKAAGR